MYVSHIESPVGPDIPGSFRHAFPCFFSGLFLPDGTCLFASLCRLILLPYCIYLHNPLLQLFVTSLTQTIQSVKYPLPHNTKKHKHPSTRPSNDYSPFSASSKRAGQLPFFRFPSLRHTTNNNNNTNTNITQTDLTLYSVVVEIARYTQHQYLSTLFSSLLSSWSWGSLVPGQGVLT